jgi:uncharacterized membrane protein
MSLLGAASVPLALWSVELLTIFPVILITLAGFAGALADSIAGAWLQAVWRTADGRLTEEKGRAGPAGKLVRGAHWLDNDVVNGIATGTGALLSWILVTNV